MRARLSVAGFVIVVGLCVSIPTAVGAAQTGSTNAPLGVGLCKQGEWQSLVNVQGQPFGNQGQCISYFIHNPVSLADLAGSFSGTTTWTFSSENGCLVNQVFDATYPGNSAVGSVTLHLDGCVFGAPFTYTGTFSITTSVGSLVGNVAGTVSNPLLGPPPYDYDLTLTVVSGTGAFSGTTGAIHVSIQWPGGGSPSPVTGSVTVP
jgi:hypothetical protein